MDADTLSSSRPTVREVLALPALSSGAPRVVAGTTHLDRAVRWAHVLEITEFEGLLLGGELVLTTGVGMPEEDRELERYAAALSEAGVAALVVELGRRFDVLPPALVVACEARGVPLVALEHVVRFVEVTQQIHMGILSAQSDLLRLSAEADGRLMGLCLDGASVNEIVAEVGALAGASVVFENLLHHALAVHATDTDEPGLLAGWAERSRQMALRSSGDDDGRRSWLAVPVRARGTTWGRLIILPGDSAAVTPVHDLVAGRGANALAMLHLLQASAQALEQEAHRTTLLDLITRRYATVEQMHDRTAALGVVTSRQQLGAIIVACGPDETQTVLSAIAEASRVTDLPVMSAEIRSGHIGVLLAGRGTARVRHGIAEFAQAVQAAAERRRLGWLLIGASGLVTDLDDLPGAFDEAAYICSAARATGGRRSLFTASDVDLPGLLSIFGHDHRIQLFVERSIGRLVSHDARKGTELLATLRAYLEAGGNASSSASRLQMSRQGFYSRLRTIERILDRDLTQPAIRTSLHAALMAWDAGVSRHEPEQPRRP